MNTITTSTHTTDQNAPVDNLLANSHNARVDSLVSQLAHNQMENSPHASEPKNPLFSTHQLTLMSPLQTVSSSDLNQLDAHGTTALIRAVLEGNLANVQHLLARKADTEISYNGDTALMLAAYNGQQAILQVLIEAHANIEARNQKQDTALMLALVNGQKNTFATLLKAHADINAFNQDGVTPLMLAVFFKQEEMLQALIANGAHVNHADLEKKTALMLAIQTRHTPSVHLLINAHADLEMRNHQDCTALLLATSLGNAEIMHMLLNGKADVQTSNQLGITALMTASYCGDHVIVQMLLDAHAHVNTKNQLGMTALMNAARWGYSAIIQTLIQAGAEINATDNQGKTALMFAASEGHCDSAQLLIDAHADVEIYSQERFTALTFALTNGKPAIIDLLTPHTLEPAYCKEFLIKKRLANVWGIKGTSTLVSKMPKAPKSFGLEGIEIRDVLNMLLRYTGKFFEQNRKIDAYLSPEAQKEIYDVIANTLSNYDSRNKASTYAKILARVRSLKPVFILGGTSKHAISMVLAGKTANEYQLILCNRGDGMGECSTEFYSLPAAELNLTTIQNLLTYYESTDAFYKMIESLQVKIYDGLFQAPQKVENCGWASSKGAFRILCEWYTNRKTGADAYKLFSHEFAREYALKEYLAQTQTPDLKLIEQIMEKYINHKPSLTLSTEILEPMESLLDNKTIALSSEFVKHLTDGSPGLKKPIQPSSTSKRPVNTPESKS